MFVTSPHIFKRLAPDIFIFLGLKFFLLAMAAGLSISASVMTVRMAVWFSTSIKIISASSIPFTNA